MSHALILGCGYTGTRLGRRLRAEGHEVTGTVRSPEGLRRLEAAGIRPLRLDLADGTGLAELARPAAEVCFHLVPPGPRPAEEIREVALRLRRAPLECFVYASSSSVYGDRGGDWVDESAVPSPDTPAGRARLEAERAVLESGWRLDTRPRIARIVGIYGPGRTLERSIREGRVQLIEGLEAWSNRIHVADLVTGLLAVWRRGANGRIYNLSDDRPHPSNEYARFTASCLGLELPVISLAEARSRYPSARLARKLGSRRVSNRKLREELGVELRFPTFREGVPAALAQRDPREGAAG